MKPTILTLLSLLVIAPQCYALRLYNKPFTSRPGIFFEKVTEILMMDGSTHSLSYFNFTEMLELSGQLMAVFDYVAPYCMFAEEDLQCHLVEIKNSNIKAKNLLTQIQKKIDRLEIYPLRNFNNLPILEPINLFGSSFRDLLLSGQSSTPQNHQGVRIHKSILTQALKEISSLKAITKYEELMESSSKITLEEYRNLSGRWLAELSKGFDNYILILEKILSAFLSISNNMWDPVSFPVNLTNLQETFWEENSLTKEFNSSNMQKLVKSNYFQMENFIIFALTLPKLQEKKLTAYRTYSSPIFRNFGTNKTIGIYVRPQFSYIILSHDNTTYLASNTLNFETCDTHILGNKLCSSLPAFQNIIINPICEVSMLVNSLPNKCNYYVNFGDFPTWTPLEKHYGWLYAATETEKVNLVCPDQAKVSIYVLNTGILQIDPNCEIEIQEGIKLSHESDRELIDPHIPIPEFESPMLKIAPTILYKSVANKTRLQNLFMKLRKEKDLALTTLEHILNLNCSETKIIVTEPHLLSENAETTMWILIIYSLILTSVIIIIIPLIYRNYALIKDLPSNDPSYIQGNNLDLGNVEMNVLPPTRHKAFVPFNHSTLPTIVEV